MCNYSMPRSALLLFDNSLDFITAFLACQESGIIAIPMFFPKNSRYYQRLETVLRDSEAEIIFCASENESQIRKGIQSYHISPPLQGIDFKQTTTETTPRQPIEKPRNPIAFIQYTSGSTSKPKGVVITQENLVHNQQMITRAFGCNEESVILSWLPFYHDMGLIGNLLHAIYVGGTCVLLNPADVVQHPLSWLKAIDKHKVTHSGGPNFMYDLCVEKIAQSEWHSLDLSSWKVAYNGSEPIKQSTSERFVHQAATAGFAPESYMTCYGLAEATLLVSAGSPIVSGESISSGKIVEGVEVLFWREDLQTTDLNSGEICLYGESVTSGYWKSENQDLFVVHEGKKYLRTGDIGQLIDGNLHVSGRSKEMLIINGQNKYPYDVEQVVSASLTEIAVNGVAVAMDASGELFVFAELERQYMGTGYPQLMQEIQKIVLDELGIEGHDIVLLSPRKIPRTSSGKLQRLKVLENYQHEALEYLAAHAKNAVEPKAVPASEFVDFTDEPEQLEAYLQQLIREKLLLTTAWDKLENKTLTEMGLSSLKGVEIVNQINNDLNIHLEIMDLFELNDFQKVKECITNLLWLKKLPTDGESIEI